MKFLFSLLLVSFFLGNSAQAVVPIDFTVIASFPSGAPLLLSMRLTGTNLVYHITHDFPDGVTLEIQGPAASGTSRRLIFDLGYCPPLPPVPPIRRGQAVSDAGIPHPPVPPPPDPSAYACDWEGALALSDSQIEELLAGLWSLELRGTSHLIAQILPVDSDEDRVPDYLDQCPDTPTGEIVTAEGCSIEQLCPCAGSWRNHGEYVRCLHAVTTVFFQDGLITEKERRALLKQAARSNCGKGRSRHDHDGKDQDQDRDHDRNDRNDEDDRPSSSKAP